LEKKKKTLNFDQSVCVKRKKGLKLPAGEVKTRDRGKSRGKKKIKAVGNCFQGEKKTRNEGGLIGPELFV